MVLTNKYLLIMIKQYIKTNVLDWVFKGIKVFFVAYLSYYLLRLSTEFNSLNEILKNNERYYLGTYATIQVTISFILYEGIGKLLEWRIEKWIRINQVGESLKISKVEEKEIKWFVNFVFKLFLELELFTIDELEHLQEIEVDDKKRTEKWRKTLTIIKNSLGIFVLGLVTMFCAGWINALFIILIVILIGLILASFFVLVAYFILIKNLHLINIFIQGYNATRRLENRKNKKLNNTIC